ncbi:MAG: class II glutamine amidotransferase, partial [Archaeoglobaceae archaeon]
DVKFSMLEASNRFKDQGKNNPHGWGIGWYKNGEPRVEKYRESAFYSSNFDSCVEEVWSGIVIAHVRYATSGSLSDRNAHPFIYKNWIFAHNGTISKDRILKLLKEPYKDFTSEPIDSEVYFRFIIQNVDEYKDTINGIKEAVRNVIKDANGANFILSDGLNLYAFRYGRNLYYLVRDPQNPLYATSKETRALIESKRLAEEKAVIIASEKITKDEQWEELKDGELLIVHSNLHFELDNLL